MVGGEKREEWGQGDFSFMGKPVGGVTAFLVLVFS